MLELIWASPSESLVYSSEVLIATCNSSSNSWVESWLFNCQSCALAKSKSFCILAVVHHVTMLKLETVVFGHEAHTVCLLSGCHSCNFACNFLLVFLPLVTFAVYRSSLVYCPSISWGSALAASRPQQTDVLSLLTDILTNSPVETQSDRYSLTFAEICPTTINLQKFTWARCRDCLHCRQYYAIIMVRNPSACLCWSMARKGNINCSVSTN